jgi:hypothetical protein
MTLSIFLDHLQELIPPDTVLFHSNSSMGEKNYSINTILEEVEQSFNGTLGADFINHSRNLASDFIHGRTSHEDVYHQVFFRDGAMQGKTQWELGGACGGNVVNINDFTGGDTFKQTIPEPSSIIGGPLSSAYRSHLQVKNLNLNDGNEVCVTCPYCGNKSDNKQRSDGKYICGNLSCASNT